MSKGNTTWTYTYDANGMRIKGTDGISDYTYIYNGDKLVRLLVDSYEYFDLTFTYDANGTPLTITERGITYYYVTNLQGDVIGIKNSSGQQIVTYTYDAWGNLLYRTNTQLADYNPLRYRGYVYDFETGLYYLQSRYYDPEMGRFINADGLVATGQGFTGNNMFAYCLNSPVNNYDPAGTLAFPGEIHNRVVEEIAKKYGMYSEQTIQYDNGRWGRADLISTDGYVWDVKRDKTGQIKSGIKQVKKYVDNTWKGHDIDLHIGDDRITADSFFYSHGNTLYLVSYRNAGDGVIAYDYTRLDTSLNYNSQYNPAICILGALAAILLGFYFGIPVPLS